MSTIEQEFNIARQRVLAGEQLGIEEQKRLVDAIRAGRYAAAEAGGKARTSGKAAKAKVSGISDEALNDQLGDLGL